MSTLDGSIWSRCSIALTCPARSHFQHTASKERWGQGLDECYCSLRGGEEQGGEEGKKRAGEEKKRKQVTDCEEGVCCSTAVVQEAA